MTCDDGDSHIFTQVTLRHDLPEETLTTASPSFCRHDPRSLREQRKLCVESTIYVKAEERCSSDRVNGQGAHLLGRTAAKSAHLRCDRTPSTAHALLPCKSRTELASEYVCVE
ncbi:unnamed protein product [Hydatigera taeniaeformis]|uniref:Uncharacterized protein n=1 Tax=Hydatigena taeniaeformis TaxID=6205 RepID=A0A0R3WQM2_HYDTA|nr:unnamed protein product [Hydatigera taeniaeformis]